MALKKLTAVLTAVAVVVSGVAGTFAAREEVSASVTSDLPTVSGLYVSEYFDRDENGKVITDTDAAGNTLLVNGDGEQIRYQDQDNPEYLLNGVNDGWGFGFDNRDEKWFDYISDGKVTHVDPTELTVTHLDGTPCTDIAITASEEDARIAVFQVSKLERVRLTYKGAELNSTLIGVFDLRTGFYSSETMSLDSQITDHQLNVVSGRSKEFYFHMTDDWDEARFDFDPDEAVRVRYWDGENEVEITGEDAKEFVELTPVSMGDPHHLIYKVKVLGKKTESGDYNFSMNYKEYNADHPDEKWDGDRNLDIKVVESNVLYAADLDTLTVKGDRYVFPENTNYSNSMYNGAGSTMNSLYMLFKNSDEDGNQTYVTDPSMLTVYRDKYDDEARKEVYTKVDSSVIRIEKVYADSALMKISYLGKGAEFGNEYAITYNGAEPNADNSKNIMIAFVPARYNEFGTYSSAKVSNSNYAREFHTDGTEDTAIYGATVDVSNEIFWNNIHSVEIKNMFLIDENGKDLSTKVSLDSNTAFTEESGGKVIYGVKITIPKGTLNASARLRLVYEIQSTGGDGQENTYQMSSDAYIFYSEPAPAGKPETTETPETTPTEKTETTTVAKISINKATVTGIKVSYTYTGKEQKPAPVVRLSGKKLTSGKDYTVTYSKNKKVGTAKIVVKGIRNYTGSKKVEFKITKAENPIKLGVSKKTYSIKKDLKKKKTFKINVKKAQGSVTYTLSKKAKTAKIQVSKKGVVTVPKNCRKGSYTITVKAKGNAGYKSAKKQVTITVKK